MFFYSKDAVGKGEGHLSLDARTLNVSSHFRRHAKAFHFYTATFVHISTL